MQNNDIPAGVTVVLRVSWNGAQLLAVAAQHLRVECVFSAATIAQRLHNWIDLLLKYLRQL